VILGDGADVASSISAADRHAVALTTAGLAYVWGANEACALGLPADAPDAFEPIAVEGLPSLSHVAASSWSTGLLTDKGGELLILGGDRKLPAKPRIAGLPCRASAIFGGSSHLAVALDADSLAHAASAAGRTNAAGSHAASGAAATAAAPARTAEAGPHGVPHVVDPPPRAHPCELAELLDADLHGASRMQLRHEIRMLRELLAAEKAKLSCIEQGRPYQPGAVEDDGLAHPSPSADDPGTEKAVHRVPLTSSSSKARGVEKLTSDTSVVQTADMEQTR
jgi:hypothetical protein